jgi:hypothetical protein
MRVSDPADNPTCRALANIAAAITGPLERMGLTAEEIQRLLRDVARERDGGAGCAEKS